MGTQSIESRVGFGLAELFLRGNTQLLHHLLLCACLLPRPVHLSPSLPLPPALWWDQWRAAGKIIGPGCRHTQVRA